MGSTSSFILCRTRASCHSAFSDSEKVMDLPQHFTENTAFNDVCGAGDSSQQFSSSVNDSSLSLMSLSTDLEDDSISDGDQSWFIKIPSNRLGSSEDSIDSNQFKKLVSFKKKIDR